MDNIFSDYKEENGLVFCHTPAMSKNNSEILYIHEAQKIGVDAVLFRRFFRDSENKSAKSEPSVCIFQREDSFFNTSEHIELHAKLWSAGEVQVYVIKGQTRIDVINARKPAEYDKSNECLNIENLILASNALKQFDELRFSAHLFGSGTFWEQTEFREKLDESQSPYIFLLDYLMLTRKLLLDSVSEIGLPPETIDKLLITSILIKFLEARSDDHGKNTLQDIYTKYKIANFSDAVENKLTIDIFDELASQFNGKIFDKFTVEEKALIKAQNLHQVASFLRGDLNLHTGQYFIWEQYDFKYIPAEIISAIYENFIQAESVRTNGLKEKGVVYTPIHLVNFLIDEVMPLDKPELFANGKFKLLDPTCGSGVFLVAGYKRLLQWWSINNSEEGIVRYPDSETAVKILEENIFGVDIKKTAILVSIFGLTTAILDKLTPQQIWNNLKFSDLTKKNIQESSFFDWAINAKNKQLTFDLVIGNPPFNVESNKKKKDILNSEILGQLDLNHKEIPNNNFALHFFEASMLLAKKICMIIPANVLLYSKSSQSYRKLIFTDYTVRKIYDFTHLRESLFTKKKQRGLAEEKKTGRTSTVAIIADNIPSKQEAIEHTVVKRMVASEKKIGLEIDYYDKHMVKWDWAIDENKYFIWKTNLLGGGRLFNLVYRLSLLPTLNEFIQKKKDENAQWIYSSGYKIGGNTKKKFAPFMESGDKITSLDEDGTMKISTNGELTNLVEFYPDERIYTPPFIVFDQRTGKHNIPLAYITDHPKEYLYFNRDFVGIHAPKEETEVLKNIHDLIKNRHNKLFLLYLYSLSGSCLVLTETEINKRDLDALPFPSNLDYLSLSYAESIFQDDVLNYNIHLGKAISHNAEGAVFDKIPNQLQLENYGETFCKVMNEVYAFENNEWQMGNFVMRDNYIVYPFGFGAIDSISTSSYTEFINSSDFKQMLTDDISNGGAAFRRIIKLYHHLNGFDFIFFIKPLFRRYWLNSIAVRDADDTFSDLKLEGF